MSKKKRKRDRSSSGDREVEKKKRKLKKEKKKKEKKKKRRRSSSTSSTSNTDSSASSTSMNHSDKKRRKKKKKDKKTKKTKEPVLESTEEVQMVGPSVPDNLPKIEPERPKMAPMTKEEWDKRQSVIRKVYDETSGRYRLIKGDGEVLEEIVSRDRHKEINRQATEGDGKFFQSKLPQR